MRNTLKKLISFCLMILLIMGVPVQVYSAPTGSGYQITESEVYPLRFICTTDIHGQITSTDEESGRLNAFGGMSKLLTKIKGVREEVAEDNSFTFDVGDILFDYTTEYIYNTDSSAIQPIWKAYSEMGYDAFTLGNHDFDYGFSYILNQISNSDVSNKCVVSNLTKVNTGEHPFSPGKLITRTIESINGKQTDICIGVIGETIPTISTKAEALSGVLATEDIVKNTARTAANLKENGADIIVVLAHSGIGTEEPGEKASDVAYALTLIDDVDIVFCGHSHLCYPCTEETEANEASNLNRFVAGLPGADTQNFLVNGKNLVMSDSRGNHLSVVSMDVTVSNRGDVKMYNRRSRVIRVNPEDTADDPAISEDVYGDWLDEFKEHSSRIAARTADKFAFQNYFAMIHDTAGIQLLNDAKTSYALKYIKSQKGSKYADLPIVACSKYSSFGENGDDYVDFTGDIKGSDIASLEAYNRYTVLYKITGSQLREFIEWSASAYKLVGDISSYDDDIVMLGGETLATPLIEDDWDDALTTYNVFDGVNYTINPNKEPRYNKDGMKISESYRVENLSINGKPVNPDDEILFVSDKITKSMPVTEGFRESQVLGGYANSQNFLLEYLAFINCSEGIEIEPDYNWQVDYPDDMNFILRSVNGSGKYVMNEKWFIDRFGYEDGKVLYLGNFSEEKNEAGPQLVLATDVNGKTGKNVNVFAYATDAAGIDSIQFLIGYYDKDDIKWKIARKLTDNTVRISENGEYTFRAVNKDGVARVSHILIDCIDKNSLGNPVFDTYTNRKSSISGQAEPGATVFIKAAGKTYSTKVNADGSFSYALPNQSSGDTLTAYVADYYGRKSETVSVKVTRTGPNRPTVSTVKNNKSYISINSNDTDAVPVAIVGNKVYGSREALNRFKASELYTAGYSLKESSCTQSGSSFKLTIGVKSIGTKITVYTLDSLNRESRKRTATVKEKAPERPTVYQTLSVDRSVRGVVKKLNPTDIYKVRVVVGNEEYTGTTDRNGYFCIDTCELPVGTVAKVTVSDEKNGVKRTSASRSVTSKSVNSYLNDVADVDDFGTGDKYFTGSYEPGANITIVSETHSYEVTCDEQGAFRLRNIRAIFDDTDMYVIVRDGSKILGVTYRKASY